MNDKKTKNYEFNLLEEKLNELRAEMAEILRRQLVILQDEAERTGCTCLFIINDRYELHRHPHSKCKVHALAEP